MSNDKKQNNQPPEVKNNPIGQRDRGVPQVRNQNGGFAHGDKQMPNVANTLPPPPPKKK